MRFQVREWDKAQFPALLRCADDASKAAQRRYLHWIAFNLALLSFGSIEGAYHGVSPGTQTASLIISGGSFFLGLAVSLLLAHMRWERIWFSGRAVAESVKSLAWKFSTGADPFPVSLPLKDALDRLTAQFTELMKDHKDLAAAFVGSEIVGDQVTSFMTGLRESAVGVRRDVYLAQRVNDQRAWYGQKANHNRRRQTGWFVTFISVQLLACIATVLLIIHDELPWHLGGIFGTVAAAILAWGQVKQYQELTQAYGYAAQELSMIAARGTYISSDDELGRFVADAETAISREHTAWVARRETS